MTDLALTSGSDSNGLQSIVLENRTLRIVVLPEPGAKIWQIVYKPLNVEFLWHNPEVRPSSHPPHTPYDDVWSGGWDELFPNDEACQIDGRSLPDHGELWNAQWEARPFQSNDSVGVHLRLITPISNFLVERTILLRPQRAHFEIEYRFTNQGSKTLPFLWKLHPAFSVSASHRLDFPPMSVVREPDFPGTLGDAPPVFQWPHARLGETTLDLRRVPDPSSRAVHFFYGTGITEGWCGVTNRVNGLGCALRFDPKVFSSCWLFASHGGWRDLNVAVLEPATGYPFQMQSMIENRSAMYLAPGATLVTSVLFSAQEGLTSIGGVDPIGRILPGKEDLAGAPSC
jgi:galactose mutarotase-like enzyme